MGWKAAVITSNQIPDTEVLLKLFVEEKEECLKKINGFFAFAVYDKEEAVLFLARDRIGIKPLLYTIDEDRFIFGSEMKAILAYGINKELNHEALLTYLQLNYIPHPQTILKGINKCPPGHFMWVRKGRLSLHSFYVPGHHKSVNPPSADYEHSKKQLMELLEESVVRRLVSDVPLGAFLSGGIDSSCVTALASRHVDHLKTFSIGYRDEPFFDETGYANQVAEHCGTDHHVFSLTNYDLLKHLDDIVNYLDEPFADSSAIPVFILSRETRKHVTVALSGDGADEIFSGYNKHYALQRTLGRSFRNAIVSLLLPLWTALPKSRSGAFGNFVRQLERFGRGYKLSPGERYWMWASFNNKTQALNLLSAETRDAVNDEFYESFRSQYLGGLNKDSDLNDFLMADTQLVLPNDMLTKVDLMSMANNLEVRVPFLDHEVVDFAFQLPVHFKIKGITRKKIIRDTFEDILPVEIMNRSKMGFEVPLLKWFRNELSSELDEVVFNQTAIEEQGIYQWKQMQNLRKTLFSGNPRDAHATVWALYVFQKWWKSYML